MQQKKYHEMYVFKAILYYEPRKRAVGFYSASPSTRFSFVAFLEHL